jgi:hypothetical protein
VPLRHRHVKTARGAAREPKAGARLCGREARAGWVVRYLGRRRALGEPWGSPMRLPDAQDELRVVGHAVGLSE